MMRLLRAVGWTLVVLLVVSLSANALLYLNFDPGYRFLRLKQEAVASGWYLPAYYSHVILGGIILAAGLLQVYPGMSRRFRRTHRALGYVYVMGILFFAAPGGLVMSLFIGRGPWVLLSFLVQATLWFVFTAQAYQAIRRGDLPAHRAGMWRSYALTFAAVTLRVYIFIFSAQTSLHQPAAYALLAWLSWVPNLMIAEVMIRRNIRLV